MVRLYHGTTLTAFEGMEQEQKLIPNKLNSSDAIQAGYDPNEYYGYLFATNNLSNAIHYSTMAIANNYKSPFHDERWGNLSIVLELELPKQLLLPDVHDAPNATSWEDSLNQCRSVRYKGELNLSCIKRVLFCHYELDTAILSCSFHNWKEALAQYGYIFDVANEEMTCEWVEEEKTPIIF
jgi:hypothetical protein